MRLDALRPGSSPRRPPAVGRALRWRMNENRGRAPTARGPACCRKMLVTALQTFAAGDFFTHQSASCLTDAADPSSGASSLTSS